MGLEAPDGFAVRAPDNYRLHADVTRKPISLDRAGLPVPRSALEQNLPEVPMRPLRFRDSS